MHSSRPYKKILAALIILGWLALLIASYMLAKDSAVFALWIRSFDSDNTDSLSPGGQAFLPQDNASNDRQGLNGQVSQEGTTSGAEIGSSNIIEINPAPPAQSLSKVVATLVNTINASAFAPPSPDPAGITYYSANHRLLISDSEVEELFFYDGANLFEMTLSGNLVNTGTTTAWSSPRASKEPTGLSDNPENGHLFISDDVADEVFELVDPGADLDYGTADDVVTSFDTLAFNSTDPEGIAYGWDSSGRDKLFIVDGAGREVYQLDPGPNGVFDGVPATGGDDEVSHFDVARISTGAQKPEGIEFNPDSGTLFIIDHADAVLETTITGVLLRVIDTSAANMVNPGGVTYGPSSDVIDPGKSLYIADRGIDNDELDAENDGKVHEMSVELPPVVVFSSFAYSMTEAATTVTINACLFYAPSETVTVDYATSDGTATAGSDYTAASGTLTFLPGEREKSFTVSLSKELLATADKTINLTLSNPTGAGTVVGSAGSATLRILDSETLASVQFTGAASSGP